MRFIYSYNKSKNHELLKTLNDAAAFIEEKFIKTDIKKLDVSEYNKKYLFKYKSDLRPILQKYNYILANALEGVSKPLDKVVMIDYGGGSGLMSLVAKAAGIGDVIFNDIFETSCTDTRILSQAFDIRLDNIICGDIIDIKKHLEDHKIIPDAMVSCDVLEHIYDLNLFFSLLHKLPGKSLNISLTTHANQLNPRLNHTLIKQQRSIEHNNRNAEWGGKKRDSLRAYLNIRHDIIKKNFSQLSEAELLKLASLTRGQKEDDIIQTAQSYIHGKEIQPLSHRTNTCDPLTGNWTERLLSLSEYEGILTNAGFLIQIQNGYYGHHSTLTKKHVGQLLDLGISLLRRAGIRLSPFFLIKGCKLHRYE